MLYAQEINMKPAIPESIWSGRLFTTPFAIAKVMISIVLYM